MTENEDRNGSLQVTVKRLPFDGVNGRSKGKVPKEEFMEVFRTIMEAKGCERAMDEDLVKKHEDAKDKTDKQVVEDLKMDAVVRLSLIHI